MKLLAFFLLCTIVAMSVSHAGGKAFDSCSECLDSGDLDWSDKSGCATFCGPKIVKGKPAENLASAISRARWPLEIRSFQCSWQKKNTSSYLCVGKDASGQDLKKVAGTDAKDLEDLASKILTAGVDCAMGEKGDCRHYELRTIKCLGSIKAERQHSCSAEVFPMPQALEEEEGDSAEN